MINWDDDDPAPDAMRIGDADRDHYIRHLSTVYTSGFLDEDEFRLRADQAAEAKTRGDLNRLVRDLPAIAELPAVRTASVWRSIRLNGVATAWRATAAPWRYFLLMLFSLAVAIGPAVYNSSNGLGNERGLATVITMLTIVLGTLGTIATGVVALVKLLDS